MHTLAFIMLATATRFAPDWGVVHVPMLIAMPVLLVLSGFFSGSETALFGLSEHDRARLRRDHALIWRAVEALCHQPRMLLITILLGNMLVNVLYFVISSVLLMDAGTGVLASAVLALLSLLLIVLVGEVGPKLLATAHRMRFLTLTAGPLLAVHRVLSPVRTVLDRAVIEPLHRLTSPQNRPPELSADELELLLQRAAGQGVIDPHEQRILQDVLELRQMRVREVMTPRVDIHALPADAVRADVLDLVRESKRTKLPVFRDDLDQVLGILHTKRYLLHTSAADAPVLQHVRPVRYVPELATLDQLLEHFRSTRTQIAVVVDEYGGTSGIVALEDVVEEIVGDITASPDEESQTVQFVATGQWRVRGDLRIAEWAGVFGQHAETTSVDTLGGLVTHHLGRRAEPGDIVTIGSVDIEVESVDEHHRVQSVLITRRTGDAADSGGVS
jgi:putative hemolysin